MLYCAYQEHQSGNAVENEKWGKTGGGRTSQEMVLTVRPELRNGWT